MIKAVWWMLAPLLVYGSEVGGFSVKRELTSSKLLFPDKVVVYAFDDPKVQGVTCYLSGIETGGVKGAVGLAEDPNQISISCKQTGTIVLGAIDKSKEGEVVFSEKQSLFFKRLKVRRMYDENKQVILYIAFSERVLDGSYETGISAIPLRK